MIYLDTETTGLDPEIHEAWEVAWAVDDGPIHHGVLEHSAVTADPAALELNGYHRRSRRAQPFFTPLHLELKLREDIADQTIVGSNPAFDTDFLRRRWHSAPWNYRLLDVAVYAMVAAGADRPVSLMGVVEMLRGTGRDIPEPDHTAAGDVATVRECHRALREIYGRPSWT